MAQEEPKKTKRPDTPLAESPETGERKPYLTRREYKEEKRQAKWQHNIEAARKGTLADERIDRAAKVGAIVGNTINTATGVASIAGALKKGGGGRNSKGMEEY